jgi:hypothetical protein
VSISVFKHVLATRAGINNQAMPKELYTLIAWLNREFTTGDIDVGRFGDMICSRYDVTSEIYQVSAKEARLDFSLSSKWIEKRTRAAQRVANPDAERIMWARVLSRIKRAQKEVSAEEMYTSDFVGAVFGDERRMTAAGFFEKMAPLEIDFNSMGTDVHILVASLGGGDGMDTEAIVDIDLFCRTLEQYENERPGKRDEDPLRAVERSRGGNSSTRTAPAPAVETTTTTAAAHPRPR